MSTRKEYDSIKLKSQIKEVRVPIGTKGVVLMVFNSPSKAYEVEFVDSSGGSLGTFTITDDQIEPWLD